MVKKTISVQGQIEKAIGTDVLQLAMDNLNEFKQPVGEIGYLNKLEEDSLFLIRNDYKINKLCFLNHKKAIFSSFYDRLFFITQSLLKEKHPECIKILSLHAQRMFLNSVGEKLDLICTRTLIYEMHIQNDLGHLNGVTPEEQYLSFNKDILGTNEEFIRILNTYSVMKKAIFSLIGEALKNLGLMTKRFLQDKELIMSQFGFKENIEKINDLSVNLSDSHSNGKIVYKLTLDNNREIIYKPRSVNTEIIYQKILSHFIKVTPSNKESLYYSIINKREYGWSIFVDHKNCKTEQEVSSYYYNFGIISFVNMLLNTDDLHFENLISSNEYPVLVDVETIMSNDINRIDLNNANNIISHLLNSTVLRSGLLPTFVSFGSNSEGFDYSAINGEKDVELPYRVPRIENMYRSDMRIHYVHPHMHSENNQVKLKQTVVKPHIYVKEIVKGFCNAYKKAISLKETLVSDLEFFNDVKSRILLKNTQQYSMVLRTSYHPIFLKDAQERIKFLHSIGKGTDISSEQGKFILFSEVHDLLNGDIPYFYSKPKSKKLYNSVGNCINFFDDTAYSVIKKRINNLSIEDMNFQKFIISLKISSPTPEMRVKEKRQTALDFNEDTVNLVYSHDIFDNAAQKILDNICNRAFISQKNNDVNWIQSVLSTEADNSWEISKMGMYLYDGIAGIAIFVNAFLTQNKQFSEKKYLKLKIALDNTLFKYANQCLSDKNFFDDKSLGAFYGESSIAYTFQILFQITHNKLYFEYARKICDQLPKQVENDDICDYLLGSAGAINVFVNMFELTRNKKYLKVGMDLLDHIEKNARVDFPSNSIAWKSDMASDPLAGLSHGASGFILSFSRLYRVTQDKRILDLINNTLNFEDTLYDHNLHNWRDNRIVQGQRNYKNNINPVAWCHGASGILLARLAVKRNCSNINNALVGKDIQLAIDSIKRMGNRDQNCLCHGNFGNILCLLEAKDELTIRDKKDLEIIKLRMAKNVLEGHWSCGLPPQYENTSFMLGISGIGYALLKMNNSKLPNILSLEI